MRQKLKPNCMGFFLFIMVFFSTLFTVVMLVAPLFIAIPVTLFQLLLTFFGIRSYVRGKKAGVYKPATLFFSGFHILFLIVYLLILFMVTIPYEEKSDTADMIAGIDKFLAGKGMSLPAWLKHKPTASSADSKAPTPVTREEQAPVIKMQIEDDPSAKKTEEKPAQPETKKESDAPPAKDNNI